MAAQNTQNIRLFRDLEGLFGLSTTGMKTIIKDFHTEMERGLSGRASSLKMLPSYIDVPRGDEKGPFMAIDVGGTNLRVLELTLKGGRKTAAARVEKFVLDKRYIHGTSETFFGFIASCVKGFIARQKGRAGLSEGLGFTFSFPVKQMGVASGELVRWTKGFSAKGVEGRDVVRLFNEALTKEGLGGMAVSVLMNDTVGTLIARAYRDPHCDAAVILGTGTNACYVEKVSKILKWSGPATRSGNMIINIEWGNFNKLRQTPYDRQLDSISENPKHQMLEKMVSGMYLGEVARLVCRDAARHGILSSGLRRAAFEKRNSFKSEHVSRVVADQSKGLSGIEDVLAQIGVTRSTVKDRAAIKKICMIVSLRAARISAAALAAVVTKMDPRLSRHHTVAIDGSVYEKHPGFSRNMKSALRELFGGRASGIRIVLTKDGSGKGAAIAAAAVSA